MSTPILTELAAPVIAMAQAHCTYLDTMRQTDTADANRTALVAFKRALKEADVPAPTLTVPATEVPADDAAQLEHRTRMRGELLNGLARAINATSTENASSTPDFILANFAAACLDAFAEASMAREVWYGKSLSIGGESATAPTAQDALIAEARGWPNGHSLVDDSTLNERLADALTTERTARVAAEEKLNAVIASGVRKLDKALLDLDATEKQRDAAIARAERAERERAETAGSLIRCRQTFSQELDTLRTQLAEAQEQLALCAANTTAADLAQEVEFLKAERDGIIAALGYGGDEDAWPSGLTIAEAIVAMREELSRLGPVENLYDVLSCGTQRAIGDFRRVLPEKESSDV